jgi:hypothetical protein
LSNVNFKSEGFVVVNKNGGFQKYRYLFCKNLYITKILSLAQIFSLS